MWDRLGKRWVMKNRLTASSAISLSRWLARCHSAFRLRPPKKVLARQSSQARRWRWGNLKPRNRLRPVSPRNRDSLLNSVRKLSPADHRARVRQRLTKV